MQLWHVPLRIDAEHADRAVRLLDAEEATRAARFRRPADRHAYIAAHAALRQILGRALGRPPTELRFESGPAGKPALVPRQSASLAFNLSHAGAYGVIAVSAGAPVGVDIEPLDRAAPWLDAPDALEAVLSAAEVDAIAACEPASQALARLRCWVRKEALLKAAGCGLSDAVRDITVSTGTEARLLASGHPVVSAGEWSIAAFEQAGHWTGAIATQGPMPRMAVHHWTWPS